MKTMTSEREDDLPKTMAVIITQIPALTIRTGWVYLRTKRRARAGSKLLMKGLIENGMPLDLAKQLANQYEEDLSVRRIVKGFGGSFSKFRDW